MSTKAKDSSLQKGGGNMMDKVRRAGILGTGSYVPEKVVTNEDLSAMMDTNDEWISDQDRHPYKAYSSQRGSCVRYGCRGRRKGSGKGRYFRGSDQFHDGGYRDTGLSHTLHSQYSAGKLGLSHTGAMDIHQAAPE